MKRDLTDILACPVCRGPLELIVEVEENDDVITGVLKCSHCEIDYPITEGIPNLTPPQKAS